VTVITNSQFVYICFPTTQRVIKSVANNLRYLFNSNNVNLIGMAQAWYMNDSETDQRLEHQMEPPNPVDIATLTKMTGVLHFQVPTGITVTV